MMAPEQRADLREVWEHRLPVIVRRARGERLLVRLPFNNGNRAWLKDVCGQTTRPRWSRVERRWEVARDHLPAIIDAVYARFGEAWVVTEHLLLEKCTTPCQQAVSLWTECECCCGGVYHGQATNDWHEVGDMLLVRGEGSGWAIRHLILP